MAEDLYELTSDAEDELLRGRRAVWRGWDFESELRPRLEKLIDTLDPCDDAQPVYMAYAHDEALFVVAWDVWLPAGPAEAAENPADRSAHMETWYVRARARVQPRGFLSAGGLVVETVGAFTRARRYGDAVDRIEAEFADLTELVLD